MFTISDVKRATNLDVVLSPLMTEALQKWVLMYANQSPWLSEDIRSLNLAAAVAAELSRAVTIEMVMDVTGSPRADFLKAQMRVVLDSIRTNTEFAAAKGGMVFKPYIKGNALYVDFVQADQFFPVFFDSNGCMTACVFVDQKVNGKNFYTRLESHMMTNTGYVIRNSAYKSSTRNSLGNVVPLGEVAEWEDLQPEATITGVKKPLFAYFKMPFANNIDTTSPLGVAVYSRAVDLMEQADKQWSNLLWEMESGQRALYVDASAFQRDPKIKDGKPQLPTLMKRLYRTLQQVNSPSVNEPGFYKEWSPDIRDVSLLNGLDAILRRIEFNCGMSYGVLSNPEAVALTATEVNNSKQRYYVTVTATQKALQIALDDLLYTMDVWTTLGNLAPIGTYTATYSFDDSIVADHDTQFTQDKEVVGLGFMSGVEFRMRNYNESEEMARKKLVMVQEERAANQSEENNISTEMQRIELDRMRVAAQNQEGGAA